LESETFQTMQRRAVLDFLDVIILLELRKRPLSGYDFIHLIHKKFDILVSTGTVYSYLYALERNGLAKGEHSSKSRTYTLTEFGKEAAKDYLNAKDKISRFILYIFSGEENLFGFK